MDITTLYNDAKCLANDLEKAGYSDFSNKILEIIETEESPSKWVKELN